MKKLLILVLFINFGNSLSAMHLVWNYLRKQKTHEFSVDLNDYFKKIDIINNNKKELFKIVKPGIESIISGATIDSTTLDGHEVSNIFILFNVASLVVAISKCGKYVITGARDNVAIVWDISNLQDIKSTKLIGHRSQVTAVAISRCGKYVITGSDDWTTRIWDITDLDDIKYKILRGHTFCIRDVAISDCGKYVVTTSGDSTARIWDISDLENIHSVKLKDCGLVRSIAISSCSKFVITGSKDGSANKIQIWNITNLDNITVKILECPAQVKSIAISKCSNYMAIAYYQLNIPATIWNIKDLNNIKVGSVVKLKEFEEQVLSTAIALSRCGKYVVTASCNICRLWDISDSENIKNIILLKRFNTSICSIAISDCNGIIVTGCLDNIANVWDIKSTWIINRLNLSQLQILEKLIKDNPATILETYKNNKSKFNENIQHYIERYLSNRLIEHYLTHDKQVSGSDVRQLIYDYLGLDNVKASTKSDLQSTTNYSCANCNKDNCKLRCSKCQLAYYCSTECQKAHWVTHRDLCKNKKM